MTTKEVLQNTLERLDSPDKWTKGVMARDAKDVPVLQQSPNAVKWCLVGALRHEAKSETGYLLASARVYRAVHAMYGEKFKSESLATFNDMRNVTLKDIHRVLKRALKDA